MHRPEEPSRQSISALKFQRELGVLPRQEISRFNEVFARKLSVENVLQGHEGCVNRLAWNEDGTLLASGSDDRRVLLWHYPDSNLAPVVVKTPHLANIFGVRFLPCSGNRRLVTGAMDCSVQLHILDASPSTHARAKRERNTVRWVPDETNEPIPSHSTKYLCHSKRVKGVEVAPQDPHMFWSVGEDGDVRQFDTRCRTSAQDEEESPNVLLSLKRRGIADDVELKCLAINKVRPYEVAVGAHDQYIRIYDRRMLCAGPPRNARVDANPMLMLAPPHQCLGDKRRGKTRQHTTGVSFGARGDRVVASYHGDHAYSFDITRSPCEAAHSTVAYAPSKAAPCSSNSAPPSSQPQDCSTSSREKFTHTSRTSSSETVTQLSKRAEECKSAGNHAYFEKDFARAVRLYSQAIHYAPHSALLYSNRSAALLGRSWEGDAWYALQDAEQALRINPSSSKAVYRRIQALRALGQLEEAAASMERFEGDFPEMHKDAKRLRETIEEDLAEHRKKVELRRTQAQARRRAQLQLRRRSAARSRRRPDGAAAANGAAANTPCPPTPVPPVNPFLEASMRSAEVDRRSEPTASDLSPSSAGRQGPSPSTGANEQPRPHADRALRSNSAQEVEEENSSAPAGRLTENGGHQDSVWDLPRRNQLEEEGDVAPPPPPESPPQPGDGWHPAASHAAGAQGLDRAVVAYQQNGDASALQDRQAESTAMDTNEPRTDVGSGVFNLPADAWDSDSDAGSDEQLHSDDDINMDEQESAEDAPKDQAAYAAFSTADVPEGRRLLQRYIGHCNIQTDIKEVTFLGDNDELVAAGSDDGRVFIYDARSGAPIIALEADEDVANCVAPHPSLPVLATSGIESAVRLWSPKGPAATPDLTQEIAANQERMRAGPSFGARLNPRLLAAITQNPELLQVIMSRTRVAGLSADLGTAGADEGYGGPPEGGCTIS
ncbi:g11715 [Coccomyxa elongata]